MQMPYGALTLFLQGEKGENIKGGGKHGADDSPQPLFRGKKGGKTPGITQRESLSKRKQP